MGVNLKITNNMKRKDLVQALKELLTDEYNAEEWVEKTDTELIQGIIDVGFYYKNCYNNLKV